MLPIAVAASIACLVWIALDAGTEDVFVVYGRMLRTAWQMKAWSVFVSCGWRLAIIAGVILWNVSSAYQATISNAADADTTTLIWWCFAVFLALGSVPWTFMMRAVRQRQAINANAMLLAETGLQLCAAPDLSSELEHAEYTNETGWNAWHPKAERFQSPEGGKLWSRVVPVVYTSAEVPRTVVIPINWSSFCVWGRQPSFAHPGTLLPFGGPLASRFRAGASVRRLAAGDCWIVEAELELSNEMEEWVSQIAAADPSMPARTRGSH